MADRELFISYWDKEYLNSQFPRQKNEPYFQLSEGEETIPVAVKEVLKSGDAFGITLGVLDYLENTFPGTIYNLEFSKSASTAMGVKEKSLLIRIVGMRNSVISKLHKELKR